MVKIILDLQTIKIYYYNDIITIDYNTLESLFSERVRSLLCSDGLMVITISMSVRRGRHLQWPQKLSKADVSINDELGPT